MYKLTRIHLCITPGLLAEIDEAAKARFLSRSDYIREAVIERLNKSQEPTSPTPPKELKLSDEEFLQQLNERYGA